MRLTELFAPEDLIVGFAPADKWQAIRDLVAHLTRRGRLPAEREEQILEAVFSREKSMSTGMEKGIALPHAAVDEVDAIQACLGIIAEESGLPFDSIDGRPSRLVVLLIIPRSEKLLHIRTLAEIARSLTKDEVREGLLRATTPQEAHGVLAQADD